MELISYYMQISCTGLIIRQYLKRTIKTNKNIKSDMSHLVVFGPEGSEHYCLSSQGEKFAYLDVFFLQQSAFTS